MPESTLNILEYLLIQRDRFAAVKAHLSASKQPFVESTSLTYSFLTYSVKTITPERSSGDLYYLWKRNIDDPSSVPELYSVDPELLTITHDHIHPVSYKTHRSIASVSEGAFTQEVMDSVKIAESIASEAYLCGSGDNYRPGYFSEIKQDSRGIHLEQVNHLHAKSIAHKRDYYLRDLKFFIPTSSDEMTGDIFSERIGNMVIQFRDHSSDNNRSCGHRIQEKIKEHRLRLSNR